MSTKVLDIALEFIFVDRDERQRRKVDIGDLIPSVRARGVLQPVLVEEIDNGNYKLIAGERRFETSKFLSLATIPARIFSDLSPLERELYELEENTKRSDLTWQENARATLKVHRIYTSLNGDEWTTAKTADMLGYVEGHVSRLLRLAEAMEDGDTNVANADTLANATTILTRRTKRAQDEALNRVSEVMRQDLTVPTEEEERAEAETVERDGATTTEDRGGTSSSGVPSVDSRVGHPHLILNADFAEWASTYSGERFNFLHVDFPYGVDLNEQAGQGSFEGGGYDGGEEVYWKLCQTLIANWDRILYPSAHVMFWISMKHYTSTIDMFSEAAARPHEWLEHNGFRPTIPSDLRINPTPLIWHKSDNKGILPDPMRMPRNIYEAALIMSTGDRFLVKPKSNVYSCPTAKADSIHTNEKPEPMLKHFFEMFVDENTRMLDPTCGSGSSIRSAEDRGAEYALGLEINPDFAERAQARLIAARKLRNLSDAQKTQSLVDSIMEEV